MDKPNKLPNSVNKSNNSNNISSTNNRSPQDIQQKDLDKAIKAFEKKRFENVALERLALMKELSIMRQV